MAYSPLVAEHFDRPRNIGRFPPGLDVVESEAGSRGQGAVFHLSARIAGDALAAVRVQVFGCPHCVAAGSWLSEHLAGSKLPDLVGWDWRSAAEALDFPAEKRGRLLILEDAVKRLTEAWKRAA